MTAIRSTTPSDLKILAAIGKQQWPQENWITARYLACTIQKKGFHYTASLGKEVVGSIMAVEEDYPKYWIHYLVVDKRYRRQGIGTGLLKKVERELARGTFLFVDLEKNDTVGLKFYARREFKRMGTVKNWFEGRKGIILAKEL